MIENRFKFGFHGGRYTRHLFCLLAHFLVVLLLLHAMATAMLFHAMLCAHVTLLCHASGLGCLVLHSSFWGGEKKTFTFIYAFSKCNRIHQFHLFYIVQLIKCVTTAFWHRVVVYRCRYEHFPFVPFLTTAAAATFAFNFFRLFLR